MPPNQIIYIPNNIYLIYMYEEDLDLAIGVMSSVRQLPGSPGFNSRSSHTKDSKMVFDAALLSIIRYGSRVKWSNPGKGVAPFRTPQCSSYWKGAFGSPSTKVANFIYL